MRLAPMLPVVSHKIFDQRLHLDNGWRQIILISLNLFLAHPELARELVILRPQWYQKTFEVFQAGFDVQQSLFGRAIAGG